MAEVGGERAVGVRLAPHGPHHLSPLQLPLRQLQG